MGGYFFRVPGMMRAMKIGKPESWMDFTSPGKVKNSSGFAATVGLLAQHVSESGFTSGIRWLWGRTGSSSTINYKTGYMQKEVNAGIMPGFTLGLSDENTQSFKLKDKWFTAFIAELGYTSGRFQVYMGPGVAFHHQKLSCINSSGKASGSLGKTVTSPMFAIGTRYALTKRMSLGLEWQRHVGSKRSWNQISKIIPEGSRSYGSPLLKMNNNIFMVSMNYVFGGK